MAKTKSKPSAIRRAEPAAGRPRCGLCGKTGKLIKTECCGQWICDDEDKYVIFSYARNSCHRNHRRFTLCGYHHTETHKGDWRNCQKCKGSFETEMYVWYGTNEYNFVKLENPPAYEPTRCSTCHRIIKMADESFSTQGEKYFCEECTAGEFARPRPKQ